VAAALDHAHRHDVIHRDIKPENILLTGDQAIVADFGISKAVGESAETALTRSGALVGTLAYMAPEEFDGETTDKSDIYALGAVLYGALTGRKWLPGTGTGQADWSGVSSGLRDALSRALDSDPEARWEDAGAFDRALAGESSRSGARWKKTAIASLLVAASAVGLTVWNPLSDAGQAGGLPRVASLAVLPFENLGGDPQEEYFVAGMHDALIGQLAQISALRVISRRSVMQYKDDAASVPEIARELNVDGVIEASVVRTGDSVRLQVQLVAARPEERSLWAEAYDRDVSDVQELHSDVARAIAGEAGVSLTIDEETRLAGTRAVNRETYEAYLRGMFYLNGSTQEEFERGLAYLHEAVEKDPGDALAYAGLALGYATIGHGPAPPPDAWSRARAAALRAVQLDPTLAEAHAALADVKLYYEWDWAGAEEAFQRANELNPSLAMNHYHYAWYLALFGRMEEAIEQHTLARELDPLTPLHSVWLGALYNYTGQYDEAAREARAALENFPDHPVGLLVLGMAYLNKGMYEEAVELHEKVVAINPFWTWLLGRTYAAAGREEDARRVVAELTEGEVIPWNALGLAIVNGALGEYDEAFHWIASEPPHAWLPWTTVDPMLVMPRDDPRFDDLLRRLNLPG
jgi:TolB-like protein/Flp pilus assembly protein TadD